METNDNTRPVDWVRSMLVTDVGDSQCWWQLIWEVKSNFVTTWLRDISSWPNELRDKMHFVTSVCVKRYVDRHEHMSRSYTSKSRSYRLSRTCAVHEPICHEHPTPPPTCMPEGDVGDRYHMTRYVMLGTWNVSRWHKMHVGANFWVSDCT